MGYVIGCGQMEGERVSELQSAVPTLRRDSIESAMAPETDRGAGMDEDKLEVDRNSGIRITILNLDRLGEAARSIAEGEASGRIRRWGFIAITTWAITATIIGALQWGTILELQSITQEISKAVQDEARK